VLAYALCIFFHLTNAVLFNIHIFPWFMIFASTIFFEPGWPRRILGGEPLALPTPAPHAWSALTHRARWALILLLAYCTFQITWPLRHHLYPGDAGWTEQGHFFAWRMMLRGKMAGVRYYLTDARSGETWNVDLREYLNVDQANRYSRDPEMILHLAHFLADEYRSGSSETVEVRALVLSSLNGRRPQLLIDPTVDLAKQPRGFHHRPWLVPLKEPLRAEPWSIPLVEWEQHVELPPLPQLGRPRRPNKS
jgi:hypothetical protein